MNTIKTSSSSKKVVKNNLTSAILETKKQGSKKEKMVSNYKKNVIETNQRLNVEKNSLGAYLDVLLKFKHLLCLEFAQYVEDIRVNNNKDKYEALNKVVRTSKNGKYNQFYTLQGLQKVCFPKTK